MSGAAVDLLNVLGDIEQALQMRKRKSKAPKGKGKGKGKGKAAAEPESVPHPLDASYSNLGAELTPVAPSSKTFKFIQNYIKASAPYVKLQDVLEVDRDGAAKRFAQHDHLEERKLLWHGTNVAVVAAILNSGLRIMPHSGGRVGAGLYFASECSKSAGYVRTAANGVGCMFLTEVALVRGLSLVVCVCVGGGWMRDGVAYVSFCNVLSGQTSGD